MRPEDSLMHHDLRFWSFWASEGSHRYECLLSSPVPFWQVPQSSQSTAQLWEKNTEAVVFIKNIHETPCKEKWSVATPLGCQHVVENVQSLLISPVTHTFFDRKVSSSYIEGHPVFHHRISMRPVLPCQAEVARALQTFSHGLLARTSCHFSNISRDITSLWVYGSTSFDINRADGMLASNAKCISRDNVTCFGSNKCPWSRGHLSWCFKCSSLLACKGSNWAVFFLDVPVPVHWIHA